MLRVILIDDEPPARRALSRLLGAHADVDIVGQAGTLRGATELVEAARPDAIFLDMELAGEQGLQLFSRLDRVPSVVFVTGHASYALQAFEVGAIDYLLKPVEASRMQLALDRLRRHVRTAPEARSEPVGGDPGAGRTTAPDRLQIRMVGRTVMAPFGDVAALSAEADFTRIVMHDARDYLVCKLLKQFHAELPTPPFLRIGRSLIVNRDRISALHSGDSGRSILSLGNSIAPIELGRIATRRLRRAMEAESR